jgi:hypothetical protein
LIRDAKENEGLPCYSGKHYFNTRKGKELKALVESLNKEKDEFSKKKAVYYEGLESGKLEMSLVGDRLKQLSKKEYGNLKAELNSLINDSPAQQKRLFLSKLVRSITVHPDKLTVEYHPPIIPNKKSPTRNGEVFSVIDMASPTGFEPVLPA